MRLKGRRGDSHGASSQQRPYYPEPVEGEGPNGEESETFVSLSRTTFVSLEGKEPQMSRPLELPLWGRGEAPRAQRSEEEPTAASGLMERVVEPANLRAALKRVRRNKGSPGLDGMTVEELPGYLREYWPHLREPLLSGTYQPQPVQRAEIPKPGGGVRQLGIVRLRLTNVPTVRDRFIVRLRLTKSSRLCCRCCSLGSIRAFLGTATGFGLGEVPTTRCVGRKRMVRADAGGSWTSTWRSSSTG